MRRGWSWVAALALWALLFVLLRGCTVRRMIYPVPPVPVGQPPVGVEEVTLPGETSVVAWHLPPSADAPVALFFHGNGENLQTLLDAGTFHRFRELGWGLLAVDYPGYGRSQGSPSEASVMAAGDAALDWLASRHGEATRLAVGWSLGAAVAARLAAERPEDLDGVALLSAWTRLADVAGEHFPRWLVGLLLSEGYDTLDAVEALELPVLVVHGGRDRIVPASQGAEVAESAPGSRWVEVPEAGHNDLLSYPEVWRELEAFGRRVG